jgi:hypothetical protein
MAEQRRFSFKIIVSEDEAEDVLDALQGIMNGLKTRRTLNDITRSPRRTTRRLPVSQDVAGSPANHSA